MEKKEFYLPSSDGRSRLHCVQWIPDGPVTASVQIVHGMTEHVSRNDGPDYRRRNDSHSRQRAHKADDGLDKASPGGRPDTRHQNHN